MLKRELKINFKNFLIWSAVLNILFLIVFLIYPSLFSAESSYRIDELMKIFPPEILAAFNMDISSISSSYGWLKSEGMIFILIISGCYAGRMGSQIVLKEESEKTIEYLYSLPVTRNQILKAKIIAGALYICLLVISSSLFNYIILIFQQRIEIFQYLTLSLSPLLTSAIFYCLCLFISTLTHKVKKVSGISLALVLISYFVQMLANISNQAAFFQYFSIFSIADTRNIITQGMIDPLKILIAVFICIVCLSLTLYQYNKKELI